MNLLKLMLQNRQRSMVFKTKSNQQQYSECFRANKENTFLKSQFEALELKQNAIIKRLEIKAAALQNSLEQKTKECAELAALCDEVTGKKL